MLTSERYRMIRGSALADYTGSDGTIRLLDVVALESGILPTYDEDDGLEVFNRPSSKYAIDSDVYAVWNAKEGHWESLPKEDICGFLSQYLRISLDIVDGALTVTLKCNGGDVDSASIAVTECG